MRGREGKKQRFLLLLPASSSHGGWTTADHLPGGWDAFKPGEGQSPAMATGAVGLISSAVGSWAVKEKRPLPPSGVVGIKLMHRKDSAL